MSSSHTRTSSSDRLAVEGLVTMSPSSVRPLEILCLLVEESRVQNIYHTRDEWLAFFMAKAVTTNVSLSRRGAKIVITKCLWQRNLKTDILPLRIDISEDGERLAILTTKPNVQSTGLLYQDLVVKKWVRLIREWFTDDVRASGSYHYSMLLDKFMDVRVAKDIWVSHQHCIEYRLKDLGPVLEVVGENIVVKQKNTVAVVVISNEVDRINRWVDTLVHLGESNKTRGILHISCTDVLQSMGIFGEEDWVTMGLKLHQRGWRIVDHQNSFHLERVGTETASPLVIDDVEPPPKRVRVNEEEKKINEDVHDKLRLFFTPKVHRNALYSIDDWMECLDMTDKEVFHHWFVNSLPQEADVEGFRPVILSWKKPFLYGVCQPSFIEWNLSMDVSQTNTLDSTDCIVSSKGSSSS